MSIFSPLGTFCPEQLYNLSKGLVVCQVLVQYCALFFFSFGFTADVTSISNFCGSIGEGEKQRGKRADRGGGCLFTVCCISTPEDYFSPLLPGGTDPVLMDPLYKEKRKTNVYLKFYFL